MGSPNHMAPELAAGHHRLASPASDVFSLGAILYELLTGRPPFLADSLQATLLKIRDTDPVAPRELDARIPRDLETICLKCLEKEPGARFASAQALADELGRFLRGEPIRTRPAGMLEKTWRWCRRKPALAGLAAAIVALAVISTVAALGLAVARQKQEREQYYAEIGLAKHHIEEGNIDRALELLLHCPPRYRHWEWGHLLYLCHQDIRTIPAHTNVLSAVDTRTKSGLGSMTMIQFSPDSQSLVTLSTDGTAKVWDVADGHALFACGSSSNRVAALAFSPDSRRLAMVQGGQVRLCDARTGVVRLEVPDLPGAATHLAWHPDGRQLAAGIEDGTVQVRDATNGTQVLSIAGGTGPISRLFYTPDGLRLVRQDALRCASFDTTSGRELGAFAPSRDEALDTIPDPEMRRFVSLDRESLITVWENGRPVQVLDQVGGQGEGNAFVVFSPDGRRFATRARAGSAKVWDTVTRRPLFVIPDRVYVSAFSPDGKRLVTAGKTTVAHVWDIDTGRQVRALRGHQELVELVAFSPDGRLVATGARDGVVKLWSATDGREVSWQPTIPWATTLSPDGRRFTTGLLSDGIAVRDTRSGRSLLRLKVNTDYISAAGFSPDGTRLVTSSRFRQPRVWDLQTGQSLFTLEGHTRAVLRGLAFSPDGQRIVTSGYDDTVRLWDAKTGRPLHVLAGPSNGVDTVAFSPDGGLLLTCGVASPDATIWEVDSGTCRRRIHAHESSCLAAVFSPDGTRVVTSGLDNTIRFWNVRSGALERELRLRGYAHLLAFSADGKRLFSWTAKSWWMEQDIPALEIWDAEAGRQILTLTGHQDIGIQLAISADGRQVLTSACDGTARQWEIFPWAESDYPGSPQTPLPSRVRQYADHYWRERLANEAAALGDPAPERVVEIPFDRSLIPPRDPQASPRLIDLTRHYGSPLNRPSFPSFGNDVDNDLRNLPPGAAEYAGVPFDVRGVIQLRRLGSGVPLFEGLWHDLPARVDGIPVSQRVRRLHLLHGTTGRERDGIAIATLVWNFTDGQRRESVILYGRHVRDWWVSRDGGGVTPEARVAWEGTNPAATDDRRDRPVGEPGKELRLFVATWENPRPDVEVTSLDLVSRETQSAPFVVAITVE